MARRCVPPTGRKDVEPLREVSLERLRREEVGARGCQLDRKREAVQPPADLPHRMLLVLAHDVAGIDGPGARSEQRQRRLAVEWAEEKLVLARDPEDGAARDQHAQAGRSPEQP
jgi:hypothetical protein